jgi:hypothetical protein
MDAGGVLKLDAPLRGTQAMPAARVAATLAYDAAALRCVSDVQLDPCYPRTADWNVAAWSRPVRPREIRASVAS